MLVYITGIKYKRHRGTNVVNLMSNIIAQKDVSCSYRLFRY